LDDELERLWTSPTDTPAYRKGRVASQEAGAARRSDDVAHAAAVTVADADDRSRAIGAVVAQGISAIAAQMTGAETELGRIDAVAGDGDHGRGMVKGTTAASEAARAASAQGAGTATVLTSAGEA